MNRIIPTLITLVFLLNATLCLAQGSRQEEEMTPEQKAAAAKLNLPQAPKQEEGITLSETQAAAAKLAQQECALCHGRGGQSVSPTFPRLAGQRAEYIETQLKAFKDETRKDPDAQAFMWGMASQLSEPMIEALAHYFEQLPTVAPQPGEPKLDAAGKEIYEQGIAAQNVPACQSCHLPQAQGAGVIPRLAGQHAAYLVKQMNSFKNGLRVSPFMEPIMHNFPSEQMENVAIYLQSIP